MSNKLDVLQNAEQLVAQIRFMKDSLRDGALNLLTYTEKDGAIPGGLSRKVVGELQEITSLQKQLIANYEEVMETDVIPDELTVIKENLSVKKDEITKGDFVRAAAAFLGLQSKDPVVDELLNSYKEEVRLDKAHVMTAEEVAENYQKYVDFNEALLEDDANRRISYIYRLDEFFSAEILASVIILRNILPGDPEKNEALARKALAGELNSDYLS